MRAILCVYLRIDKNVLERGWWSWDSRLWSFHLFTIFIFFIFTWKTKIFHTHKHEDECKSHWLIFAFEKNHFSHFYYFKILRNFFILHIFFILNYSYVFDVLINFTTRVLFIIFFLMCLCHQKNVICVVFFVVNK